MGVRERARRCRTGKSKSTSAGDGSLSKIHLSRSEGSGAAEAQIAHHPLQGWRDLAIIRTLGDAGLRCKELVDLGRREFVPKRKEARLRVLAVRHGKRKRRRKVDLKPLAERAHDVAQDLPARLGARAEILRRPAPPTRLCRPGRYADTGEMSLLRAIRVQRLSAYS